MDVHFLQLVYYSFVSNLLLSNDEYQHIIIQILSTSISFLNTIFSSSEVNQTGLWCHFSIYNSSEQGKTKILETPTPNRLLSLCFFFLCPCQMISFLHIYPADFSSTVNEAEINIVTYFKAWFILVDISVCYLYVIFLFQMCLSLSTAVSVSTIIMLFYTHCRVCSKSAHFLFCLYVSFIFPFFRHLLLLFWL